MEVTIKVKLYKLHCFILKRINFSEADRILTVFSGERGKQTLIAKGLRKSKSKRVGLLELFNRVQMVVVKSRGSLDIITEVELTNSYQQLASNYLKTQMAYQLVELMDRLTKEEQPHPEVYELLGKAFAYIDQTDLSREKFDQILVRFKTRILEYLGFGVPLRADLTSLQAYIEEIIEKKLVVREAFAVYNTQNVGLRRVYDL